LEGRLADETGTNWLMKNQIREVLIGGLSAWDGSKPGIYLWRCLNGRKI
jgi:hypothetical protein